MHRFRSRIATAGAGLAAVAVALFAGAPSATAAPVGYSVTADPISAAAGWLAGQFSNSAHHPAPDGDHFESVFQGTFYPSYGENADVIFGLAAAKAGATKIDTALAYLSGNADAYGDITNSDGFGPYDGSVAKLALAAIVAGADPTSFGGFDLMATLAKDECPTGSTACTPGQPANIFSSTSEFFVILAEARTGGQSAPTATALAYLSSLQCSSGGFTGGTAACGSGAADLDATSYAIMALQAVGGTAAQAEIDKAVAWLKQRQAAAGYWVSQGIPNVNSTGLAVAALQGQGADVTKARAWLLAQQVRAGVAGAGALKYAGTLSPTTTSATSPSVLATAQGLLGLVDGASLATVTAAGASAGVGVFAPRAKLSGSTVRAGATQTATANGFAPGERVRVTIHSAPVTVATVTASPIGSVQARYRVPTAVGAGSHTVTLTGLTSGLTADRALTVTVASGPSTAPGGSAGGATGEPPAGAGGVIAATGQDSRRIALMSGTGLIAVLVGGALLVVGRRREP
ncbi:MAG TPA: prenyltransferase/squalene oxidase repeat-containing protein [Jatrophihabitans sp.]|nr:prenyltransferase/squalene oxidase repeat-containing protein [Jatrophihabitans sp.]